MRGQILQFVRLEHKCCDMGCDKPSTCKVEYVNWDTGTGGIWKYFCDEHAPTTETEVMPSVHPAVRNGDLHRRSAAPPQPAPSPTGAMDVLEYLQEFSELYPIVRVRSSGECLPLFQRAAAEITRLRTAPVTEDMVERAANAITDKRHELEDQDVSFSALDWEYARAALTAALAAALAPGGG